MTIIESLLVSLFCIVLVFLVLACVCALVIVLSKVLSRVVIKGVGSFNAVKCEAVSTAVTADEADKNGVSAGGLKLIDVDEKTAAMVMAIVSHESQIPLYELSFKSIKAVE